jgi:hypothetical protein
MPEADVWILAVRNLAQQLTHIRRRPNGKLNNVRAGIVAVKGLVWFALLANDDFHYACQAMYCDFSS